MSGFDYTTTGLLADIKRKAFVPISQITFDDAALLSIADEEMQVGIVPMVMRTREEYFVSAKEYTVQGNTREFEIPERAIGAKLRDVTIIANPGTSDGVVNERSLPEINAEDAVWNNTYNNFLSLQSFFLRNNYVVLSPSATSFQGQQLKLYYFKRPSKLIQTTECSKITGITGSNTCTVNIVPTNFGTGGTISITADIVKATPPFQILQMDITVSLDTNTNIATFSESLSDLGISNGDYICLANESPIPLIPVELHSLLAQRAAVKILSSLGDDKNFKVAQNRLEEMEKNILELISNRVEGANRKVVNNFSVFNTNPYRRF